LREFEREASNVIAAPRPEEEESDLPEEYPILSLYQSDAAKIASALKNPQPPQP
jgi:hypothetical protein